MTTRFYIVASGRNWNGNAAGYTLILDADQLPTAARRIDTDWRLAVGVLFGFLRRGQFPRHAMVWYGDHPTPPGVPPLQAVSHFEIAKVTPAGRSTIRSLDFDPPHEPFGTPLPAHRLEQFDGAWLPPEQVAS